MVLNTNFKFSNKNHITLIFYITHFMKILLRTTLKTKFMFEHRSFVLTFHNFIHKSKIAFLMYFLKKKIKNKKIDLHCATKLRYIKVIGKMST